MALGGLTGGGVDVVAARSVGGLGVPCVAEFRLLSELVMFAGREQASAHMSDKQPTKVSADNRFIGLLRMSWACLSVIWLRDHA